MALNNKGHALGRLGRIEDAKVVLDDLVARFDARPSRHGALPESRDPVPARARARCAGRRRRPGGALRGSATEPDIRKAVAAGLDCRGCTLRDLGRQEEAVAVFDELLGRFGDATELGVRNRVASALCNKASLLGRLGRRDELVARAGDATEPRIRKLAATLLFDHGVRLLTPGSREQVALALRSRAGGRMNVVGRQVAYGRPPLDTRLLAATTASATQLAF